MESYVYKRRNDGLFIFNLHKTWEKLVLAARVIAAVENPADVCVISGRELGQVCSIIFVTPVAVNIAPAYSRLTCSTAHISTIRIQLTHINTHSTCAHPHSPKPPFAARHPQVRCPHRLELDCRPLHPRHVHQPDHPRLQGAPPPDRDRPPH